MNLLKITILAFALFGFQQVAQAQCSMGDDTGCGSDMREEIIAFAKCTVTSWPAPPYYNNPNCGNTYSMNFFYYVDGDGDADVSQLESRIYNWLNNIFGGQAGAYRAYLSLSCNERAWNLGTITITIDCN